MTSSSPDRAPWKEKLVHYALLAAAFVGLTLLVRPWTNAFASAHHFTGLDEEVMGGALAAILGATATALVELVLFLVAGGPTHAHVGRVVKRMRHWLLALPVHWGPKRSAPEAKVANAAEGIIAILDSNDDHVSQVEADVVRSAIQFLVENSSYDGLQSLSLHRYTTHCTAMGLFAIVSALRAGRYGLGPEAQQAADQLAHALKRNRSDHGWGFLSRPISGRSECRLLSTLWALRALNRTPAVAEQWYADQYTRLLRVPAGRFGFRYEDEPRTSVMSLFLICVHELENAALRRSVEAELDIPAMLSEILEDVRTHPWSETEEYPVFQDGIEGEKLSWVHVSIGLAVQALSLWSARLRVAERRRLAQLVRRIVRDHVAEEGYFRERRKDSVLADPEVYKAAYVISALKAWTRT